MYQLEKKGIKVWLFFCTLFIMSKTSFVYAEDHQMQALTIHVFLQPDGSAVITEKREVTLVEGTENYLVIENLGQSLIQDFTVVENGQPYLFEPNWSIDASRQEKQGKNGIIQTEAGYELVWGIGDYGAHTYELQYTVTEMVKQLTDSQLLFWRFVNDQTNLPPQQLQITIEMAQPFEIESEQIWGFGFPGGVHFEDGLVVATSSEPLTSEDYATLLVRFLDGTFQVNENFGVSFEQIKEQAFDQSDYEKSENYAIGTLEEQGLRLFTVLFLPISLIFVLVLAAFKRGIAVTYKANQYQGQYTSEFPYDGPIIELYSVVKQLQRTNFERLFSTLLLKWVYEGRIDIQTLKEGGIFKTSKVAIVFLEENFDAPPLEKTLFDYLKLAAAGQKQVTQKEFSKWVTKNRKLITQWEKDVVAASQASLVEKGFLVPKESGFFKKNRYELTPAGENLQEKIYLLCNYLQDFSKQSQASDPATEDWDELLIWANFFGLLETTYPQMQQLVPNALRESVYSEQLLTATRIYAHQTSVSSNDSSSGSGGSTSSGGGGGSFGGGSGGGTR